MNALLLGQMLLLVGAALCLLPVHNHLRAALALATQALALLAVGSVALPVALGAAPLVSEWHWGAPVGTLKVRLDALGAFFLVWSLPMTLLGSVYAIGYLRQDLRGARHGGLHFALLNLTALSFLLVYTADHALVFLLGWEIAALAAWLLVIWNYSDQKVRFAGFNYLVSTHIGLIFLVAAFMMLMTHAQSWELAAFGRWLQTHPGSERDLVFVLLLISFALKSAFFPFHSWLPRAHAAAPAHVSALMSGVIHKAGLYALVRFLLLIGQPEVWMGWVLVVFSLVSALIGVLYTAAQRDLKRLLGYSSTENVGIAGLGLGVGSLGLAWNSAPLAVLGFAAALLHVLNHAVFKCLLFYGAGAVYQACHTVDLERLGGLMRAMPTTAWCFLLGAVAIAGLPPLNGFASEFLVYQGLFHAQVPDPWSRAALVAVAAGLALVGAVSALAMARAFGVAFLGSPRDPGIAPHEVNRWMRAPLALHALGIVLLGLFPTLGLGLVAASAELALAPLGGGGALHGQALAPVAASLARISAVAVALVGAVALLLWLRAPRARGAVRTHHTWGCGYGAPNARMQFTASSFSWDFSQRFRGVVLLLRRQRAPRGYFPHDAYLISNCVDAVERRLFTVIQHGDETALALSRQAREDDPRWGFALALLALVLIAGLIVLTTGPLP